MQLPKMWPSTTAASKVHLVAASLYLAMGMVSLCLYTLTNLPPLKTEWQAKWKLKESCFDCAWLSMLCQTRNMISCIFQLNCKANAANLKRNSVFIQSIRWESVWQNVLWKCTSPLHFWNLIHPPGADFFIHEQPYCKLDEDNFLG